jgi:hypothetical protein
VTKAIETQLGDIVHAAFQVNGYESYIALAEKLNALAPIDGPAKTIFFSTGAEAVENAIKIARYATKPEHVLPRLPFEDHRLNPGLRQQLPEQQARWARTDDRHLSSRLHRVVSCVGSAAVMPLCRFASTAAGDVRKSSSSRAASGRVEAAPIAAEKVVVIRTGSGIVPNTSMPSSWSSSESC